jgi:hypothetical protein
MSDLKATINQSIADKIVDSVTYPFTVFEHRKPFGGFGLLNAEVNSDDEVSIDSKTFLDQITSSHKNSFKSFEPNEQIIEDLHFNFYSELTALKENLSECLISFDKVEKHNIDNSDNELVWDGPDKNYLLETIENLSAYEKILISDNSKSNNSKIDYSKIDKIIEFKGQITWVRVTLGKRPVFKINGKRFDLNLPSILPSGTAEVWAKHIWLKCVRKWRGICYGWKLTTKETRLSSVSLVDVKFKVKAHAIVEPKGSLININGSFDEFRIDYPILKEIPLEKLGNYYLKNLPVAIFDAGVYVKTIPVLDRSFRVSNINIPNEEGQITIEVTVSQN